MAYAGGGGGVPQNQLDLVATKIFSINQAAGTYDIFNASADLLVLHCNVYVNTAADTLTSVSIQTDQTNAVVIMSGAEGAVTNLTAQKNIPISAPNFPFFLRGGQKIRYSIVGSQGNGQLILNVVYRPIIEGAFLN